MIATGTTFRLHQWPGSHAAAIVGRSHLPELRREAQKNHPHRELGCPCAGTKRSSSQRLGNKVAHDQCPAIPSPCRSASPAHWETGLGTLLEHSARLLSPPAFRER